MTEKCTHCDEIRNELRMLKMDYTISIAVSEAAITHAERLKIELAATKAALQTIQEKMVIHFFD